MKNIGGLGGTPHAVCGRLAAMAAAGEIEKNVADHSVVVAAAKLETFSGHCTGGGPARRCVYPCTAIHPFADTSMML